MVRKIYIFNYVYISFVVSFVRISVANLALYCNYDRFLNGNLIKSLDSYTFSSLSSLELL